MRLEIESKLTTRADMDESGIPNGPASVEVTYRQKPVLYLPDGRVLVRVAGFTPGFISHA